MNGFNKVILAGNLTRDPELKYTPKGTPVANFGLAVNESWKNEQGEKQERVTFIDVQAWGKAGEVIAQYMRKGKPLLIEGRLQMDSWVDRQTQEKRSKLKVVLDGFNFLPDGSNRDGAAPPPAARPSAPTPTARELVQQGAGAPPPEEEDVPF